MPWDEAPHYLCSVERNVAQETKPVCYTKKVESKEIQPENSLKRRSGRQTRLRQCLDTPA